MVNNHIDRIISFTFDEHGNQLSRMEEDKNNMIGSNAGISAVSAPDQYRAVYEYDSRGNWIKKTEKNTNGRYNAVSTRKITYVQ